MDAFVAKMLSIHVHGMVPASSVEIGVTPLVQSAALVSLGLLYQGTGHRRTAEACAVCRSTRLHPPQVLCSEIGRRPNHGVDVEFPRESHSLSAGLALGMVMLGTGSRTAADARFVERLFGYVEGGRHHQTGDTPTVHRVLETETINTDVTAPSALLALGLMFHKTGDAAIAHRLALPNTLV